MTMKRKTILLSVASLSLMLFACGNATTKSEEPKSGETTVITDSTSSMAFNYDTTKLKAGDVFFQCDMHPEVLSDKMGLCPECEMDLTELKKQ